MQHEPSAPTAAPPRSAFRFRVDRHDDGRVFLAIEGDAGGLYATLTDAAARELAQLLLAPAMEPA